MELKIKSTKKKKAEPINPDQEYPVLPMRDSVVFPYMTSPFFIGRRHSLESLELALNTDRRMLVLTQKKAQEVSPSENDLYFVGSIGKILQVMKLPNQTIKILFEAESRVKVTKLNLNEGRYSAFIEEIPEPKPNDSGEVKKLVQMIKQALGSYFKKHHKSYEVVNHIQQSDFPPNELIDRIAPLLSLEIALKQELLEETKLMPRLEMLYRRLIQEEENKKLEEKIKNRIQSQIGKSHKEFYLNEQMKAIQKELGGGEDGKAEINKLEEQIKSVSFSEEAKEAATAELKRLQILPPFSSEANIVRNYLEWLLGVPWKKFTKDNYDLTRAQKVLDAEHHGLEKVKERIIEFIAVSKNIGIMKGPIICLVGPPGVGKTSLAKSIAKALNKEFVRFSLGGVRDEAEIRGHRRTYIGAMPGKIIQMMKKAKSSNPLILLDEIDKITQSHMGDPAAALLEVLDPEQNHTFMDHFLEVEYDLSKVLFLCTANSVQTIPPALYDRMEIISLSGYTEFEKYQISKKHLIPKQTKENGADSKKISFQKSAVLEIIRFYTKESGIRNLERSIGKVCRKAVTELMKNKSTLKISINNSKVREYLGVPIFKFGIHNEKNEIGICTGLAYTTHGGDILFIEVSEMKGKGNVHLTGKLGDVMKESATTAMSYVRSNANRLGIYNDVFQNMDIHVHVPEGATPKDGPSAGITLATAIISLLTGIPIQKDFAMTGEMTLRGRVLEIGGLKEKVLAAKRSGIFKVIIPQDNLKSLEEFSEEIMQDMQVFPVSNINEVIGLILERQPTPVNDEDLIEIENTPDKKALSMFHEDEPIQANN